MFNRYDKQKYMKKYYKKHRKKMINQSKQWHKDNPKRVSIISKRYRDKGRRREPENKTNYDRKEKKVLLIKQYGKDLESKKENLVLLHKRLFCIDCLDYKTDLCFGWDNCKYREEVLQLINDKKENIIN